MRRDLWIIFRMQLPQWAHLGPLKAKQCHLNRMAGPDDRTDVVN